MKLYARDFHTLLDAEVDLWNELKEKEIVYVNNKPTKLIKSLYTKYPKAVRHNISLFPNNFIDAVDLRISGGELSDLVNEFTALLDSDKSSERDVLNFIRNKNAYFIVGSILKGNYPFGHQALYLFPEIPLPPNYKADFLLVGENSHGHHFVFVEFESPNGSITTKDGDFGDSIRKGIKQIEAWETWLEKNYSHLKLVFEQSQSKNQLLPNEFIDFDSTRIHFVVVAGRRSDYTDATYLKRRKNSEQRKLLVIHYDNLIDYSKDIIGELTY